MGKKQNPLLDAFERKLEAQYQLRLKHNSEIGLLALIIAADDKEIPDVGGLLFRFLELSPLKKRSKIKRSFSGGIRLPVLMILNCSFPEFSAM